MQGWPKYLTLWLVALTGSGQAQIPIPSSQAAGPSGGDFSRVMVDIAGRDQNNIVDSRDPDLKRFGVELIFHRATLGVAPDADDEGFVDGLNRILVRGFRGGAYHVIYPKSDDAHSGSAQADTFFHSLAAVCGTHHGASIVTAVDWEPTYRYVKVTGQKRKKRVLAGTATPSDVLEFLQASERKYHVSPIVYTGTDVIAHFRGNPAEQASMASLTSHPLWIATYQQRFFRPAREGTQDKQILTFSYDHDGVRRTQRLEARVGYIFPISEDVSPWADWMFWQYGGGMRGVRNVTTKSPVVLGKVAVDMSFFNGTRSEFGAVLSANSFNC